MKAEKDEEKYVITPWGCMLCVLKNYGINLSGITDTIGQHMVDDFMKLMETAGHIEKVKDDETR